MHCRLVLARPPRVVIEAELIKDRFLQWLDATWMAQQLPWALLLFELGGAPWLVWGIPVRIAVCLTGFWFVGHVTHRRGDPNWSVADTAVQGYDLPGAALITFGEAWHGNHHAWPDSARLGVKPGQHDPGWWVLVALRRVGLVWNLKEPSHLMQKPGLQQT